MQVIAVDGPLKSGIEFDLDENIQDAIAMGSHPPKVILDLSKSPFMNSASLGILLHAYRKISDLHGMLVLAALSPDIKELIKITRLETIFHVEDSLVDAQKIIEEMTL